MTCVCVIIYIYVCPIHKILCTYKYNISRLNELLVDRSQRDPSLFRYLGACVCVCVCGFKQIDDRSLG